MAQHHHSDLEMPLQRLFEVLRREARLPLGMAEYLDVLRALQSGFGMQDLNALRRLCLLMWAHSKEQLWQVNHHFDRIIVAEFEPTERSLADTHEQFRGNGPAEAIDPERRSSGHQPIAEPPAPVPATPAQREQAAARAAAQAQAQAQTQSPTLQPKRYRLRLQYAHISDRLLAQAWRKLRVSARTGPKTEIDLGATIREAARKGSFEQPALRNTLENAADLHLLIDREGSMVPFHGLGRALMQGARTVGNLPKLQVRYFHDSPQAQVYRRELLTQPQALTAWLGKLNRKRSFVLVLSDAGAARGNHDPSRIAATQAFFAALQGHCKAVAWLNPMPQARWEGSSAAAIAEFVPMFEATAKGLHAAVDHLRRAQSFLTHSPIAP